MFAMLWLGLVSPLLLPVSPLDPPSMKKESNSSPVYVVSSSKGIYIRMDEWLCIFTHTHAHVRKCTCQWKEIKYGMNIVNRLRKYVAHISFNNLCSPTQLHTQFPSSNQPSPFPPSHTTYPAIPHGEVVSSLQTPHAVLHST